MTINAAAVAYLRHHLCEFLLFVVLATPVLVMRPFLGNVVVVVLFFVMYFGFSYQSERAVRLRVDDDGLQYLAGGRDRSFIAWSEIGAIVPRRFRGWPAEDALVVLDHADKPLLVAGVAMFGDADLRRVKAYAGQRVEVREPVVLSALTGRAGGHRRPDLVPERTSERFLASSIGGMVLAALVAVALFSFVR